MHFTALNEAIHRLVSYFPDFGGFLNPGTKQSNSGGNEIITLTAKQIGQVIVAAAGCGTFDRVRNKPTVLQQLTGLSPEALGDLLAAFLERLPFTTRMLGCSSTGTACYSRARDIRGFTIAASHNR